jgi:hypothetical protein
MKYLGFKLTTLVVVGTDCIGSCKSNYHMITTTMAHNTVWLLCQNNNILYIELIYSDINFLRLFFIFFRRFHSLEKVGDRLFKIKKRIWLPTVKIKLAKFKIELLVLYNTYKLFWTDISCLGGVFAKNTFRETKYFPRR